MALVMLSVTSRSMLMILLSTPSVIKHLIYCNNYNWLMNWHMKYDIRSTVDCGQEVACWFQCRKTSIGFDRSNYTHSTNLEMDGSVLEEK